jgi:hypothetical protein
MFVLMVITLLGFVLILVGSLCFLFIYKDIEGLPGVRQVNVPDVEAATI